MNTKYLNKWDAQEESLKAIFMEHMYKCSGRSNGLYTGLWQDFCLSEAGPMARKQWFREKQAIDQYEKAIASLDLGYATNPLENFVPTFHD